MKIGSLFAILLIGLVFISADAPPSTPAEAATTSPWLVQPPTDYEKAVNVVNEQLAALRVGDSSKAYYAYTTKEFRKAFSLENFKVMIKRYPVFGRNRTFQVASTDFDGTTVIKLKGKLIAVNGDSMNVNFDVVLEDNEWKIHNVQMTQPPPGRKAPGPVK